MRNVKIYLLSLVFGITFFGSACAFASGYPFGLVSQGDTKIVVVAKFASDPGQFTRAEAQNLSVSVAALVPLIQSLLGSSESVSAPTVFTPSQLADIGIVDADFLINWMKANYVTWNGGYDTHVVLNISKVAQYSAGFGPNMRLDIYIADMAALVGVQANYLYAASLEVPYMYTSLLNSLTNLK